MSRYPRYLRRQHEATDRANVDKATRTTNDDTTGHGSAGRLRGIPAIGPNCPGHIRDTDPGGRLLRTSR